MNDLLSVTSTASGSALNWPVWVAAYGFAMFSVLALYAIVLLFASNRLPKRLRFIQFASLRSRLVIGFILAGALPVISLAMVLSKLLTEDPAIRLAIAAVALAWLIGTLVIGICLALTIAKGISGPLEALVLQRAIPAGVRAAGGAAPV